MIHKQKTGGVIFIYMLLFFFFNSCTSPEDHALKVPVSDSSAPIAPQKTGPQIYTVEIKDMKFQPAELYVRKGDTVIWVNRDMVTHCVTEEKTKAWASSNIVANSSWKMVVENNADYFCAIHVVMKGKIILE